MASTPLSLWTSNPETLSPLLTATPRIPHRKSIPSPTKGLSEPLPGLSLTLKAVLGNTTSSVSGFDVVPERSCFAVCAGSAAILSTFDENFNVCKRHYRAKPDSQFGGADTPAISTPDWRKTPSLRNSTYGLRATLSPADFNNTPTKVSAKQRTRAATSISLSRDGKLLAIGETGYNPRILFFYTSRESSDLPYAALSEHSFGVRCLSFSPDSRWLCSVGEIHDGYIFLWAIHQRTAQPKLFASNKCTSAIQAMVWIGNNLVTVGTRHVKVWRVDTFQPPSPSKSKFRMDVTDSLQGSPASKTLPGRNCLLGPMLESNFTCAAAISPTKGIICSEQGDFCILDDTDAAQKLFRVHKFAFGIRSVSVDLKQGLVWLGCMNGDVRSIELKHLEGLSAPPESAAAEVPRDLTLNSDTLTSLDTPPVAIGHMKGCVVSVGSNKRVQVLKTGSLDKPDASRLLKKMDSHAGPVQGSAIGKFSESENAGFFTWDSMGKVMFWANDGSYKGEVAVPLEQIIAPGEDSEANELKVLRLTSEGGFFVSGDKYGVLRVFERGTWNGGLPIKAHQGEVSDIKIQLLSDSKYVVASCGRDRTVQLFEKDAEGLNILQTVDHHASSVTTILFADQGRTLFSASSDRTVVVHALATTDDSKAYVPIRIMTLKQSPISLTLCSHDRNLLAVSTMDKQVHKFDVVTGQCMHTARLSDDLNGSVLLTSTVTRSIEGQSNPLQILLGVSSTDKSVRIHDLESGSSLLREYGHSEGITDVSIISEETEDGQTKYGLVSTGLDGTIMLWDLLYTTQITDTSAPISPAVDTPTLQPPLRRVLSRTAIAEFSKTLEANGLSPITTATPSRQPSPTRLKKRLSKYSLNTTSTKPTSASLRRVNRSPSPPSPATPIYNARKPIHRTKSAGNFNDVSFAAEQLCKSMRSFRKKLTAASSEHLQPDAVKELEREMALTVKTIGQNSSAGANGRRHPSSEANLGDLLDQYSDRLARMVEEKVKVGIANGKGGSPSNGVVRRDRWRKASDSGSGGSAGGKLPDSGVEMA